jgi:bifunctional DNase/RNase
MQHIELTVKGLSYSQGKSGAYALILAEVGEGGRKLPVVIGGAEAQSIAVAMEKSVAPWKNMLNELGVTLEKVVIHRLVNGVFYASLYTIDAAGTSHIFDSRPSDAVALAVRFECQIFATPEIMEHAGITEKEETKADVDAIIEDDELDQGEDSLEETREELELLLSEAVENEDYELAARLRDKLDKL